jgi:hypothetical protein
LGWVVIDRYELVVMYEVLYFVFIFFLCITNIFPLSAFTTISLFIYILFSMFFVSMP